MEEQRRQGVPPHWMVYVAVAGADAADARARELGARVVAGPLDVADQGRMAVLQDPQGAHFALWEARGHSGNRANDLNYRHCWSELATTDAAGAREFYTRLFGWTTHEQDIGGVPYTTWLNGGAPGGGMLQMTREWGNIPPHWMLYFSVPSCDTSAEQVRELAGGVKAPPNDIPGVGRFAVVSDPQGAVFSLIQLAFAGQGQSGA